MTNQDQLHKAERFHEMHRGQAFLLPNAWDAMSAIILAAEGFPAVATTSGGVSWALGYPDGEQAPWPEIVAAIQRITSAVKVPVSCDIEGGFADSPSGVREHVGQVIAAGAVGINLEDSTGGRLRPIAEACSRISEAREAALKAGIPLHINARTDVFHLPGASTDSAPEALRRAVAYLEAGASSIFLFGLADLATLAALAPRIASPINVVGRPGGASFAALAAAGARRVSIAAGLSLFAYGHVKQAAAGLRVTGDFDCLQTEFTRARAQSLASNRAN
jgi:2-methylisocitrate lyase-like PEP mutase family enzyme